MLLPHSYWQFHTHSILVSNPREYCLTLLESVAKATTVTLPGVVGGWIILGQLLIPVTGLDSLTALPGPKGKWVTKHKGGESVPDRASISSPFLNLFQAACLAYMLFSEKYPDVLVFS